MRAPLLGKGHEYLFACDCGTKFISGSGSKYCIECGDLVTSKTKIKVKVAKFHASKLTEITCANCKSDLMTDMDASENCFCPICAEGMNLEDMEIKKDENEEDLEEENSEEEDTDEENSEEESTEEENDDEEESDDEKSDEEKEEDPEELKKLIQASYLAGSDSWIFFKANEPFFKIEKKKVSKEIQPLFSNNQFYDLVTSRIGEVGLTKTLREFNASVYNIDTAADSLDIETYAFEKFQSSILPKFVDCLYLAIQGSSNVFSDLNTSIKSSLVADLVGSGFPKEEVMVAVNTSINASGPELFSNFVIKALELYKKDQSAFKELKAVVASANPVSYEDFTRSELISSLTAGNLNVKSQQTGILAQSQVQELRSKLNFRRR